MNVDRKYSYKDCYFNTIINVYNNIFKYILLPVGEIVSDNSNRGIIYLLKTNTKWSLRTY